MYNHINYYDIKYIFVFIGKIIFSLPLKERRVHMHDSYLGQRLKVARYDRGSQENSYPNYAILAKHTYGKSNLAEKRQVYRFSSVCVKY